MIFMLMKHWPYSSVLYHNTPSRSTYDYIHEICVRKSFPSVTSAPLQTLPASDTVFEKKKALMYRNKGDQNKNHFTAVDEIKPQVICSNIN